MILDYRAIGQRIRSIRLKGGLTQEKLAELTELSNQHISNIETGSTKLSLQTLVKIANALDSSADEILCDNVTKTKPIYDNEILQELADCNEQETRFIADTVKHIKKTLRYRLGTNK
ncbi:helix-turn-helix domain-containing protein [Anaeropeptidivorans aminofermentans]|jgi:transcriptional regulator with XRE-family HTH domain|uniref:helix-turn-helix domain-containing protein n=1 Tax=Anaeropeptidivorans aminofermentans TaxID=2934315 RepID=UPI002024E931|nr:helix-turn-helix transcriptional regulator [Anaeropeptidivorans aminofermentans]